MSLEAFIQIENNELLHIQLKGCLNFEDSLPLRKKLQVLIIKKTNKDQKILLDLEHLDFVGSSGIGIFIETLKILFIEFPNINVSNFKFEFYRVLKLYQWDQWENLILDKNKEFSKYYNQVNKTKNND